MVRQVLLLATVALAACASVPAGHGPAIPREASLQSRVADWWQARTKGDYKTQYDLQDPAYRSRTSYESSLPELIRRNRVAVKDFEIVGIKPVDDARSEVALRVTILLRGDRPIATEQTEVWVWRDNTWFKEYQPIQTPFSRMETMGK